MSRIIILEGPDGAGKSTYAEELADELNGIVLHQGPFRHDPVIETLIKLEMAKSLLEQIDLGVVVLDRAHLGELVYGPIFRRGVLRKGERVAPDEAGYNGARLRIADLGYHLRESFGVEIVLCLPPFEVVKQNWIDSQGDQMFEGGEGEKNIRRVYDEYASMENIVDRVYDYSAELEESDA